jgi:hypothetical protein
MERKGVKLLLAPGTKVPRWVTVQDLNVRTGWERLNGKRVRTVSIADGEAFFGPEGVVDVRVPGARSFLTAFAPLKVFEIRDLEGGLLRRNYFFCEKCVANSGKIEGEPELIAGTCGKYDAKFLCSTPGCDNSWSREI